MTDAQKPAAPRRAVVAGGAAAAVAAVLAISGPLIGGFEGKRLVAYKDPIGIATECEGHTGPDVRVGQQLTDQRCAVIFDADQRKAILAIGRCTKVDVPIQAFAAFTSFSFNAGAGTYCTRFATLVNAGQLKAACAKLSLYVYAGGRVLPGLVARRAKERALCEQGAAAG